MDKQSKIKEIVKVTFLAAIAIGMLNFAMTSVMAASDLPAGGQINNVNKNCGNPGSILPPTAPGSENLREVSEGGCDLGFVNTRMSVKKSAGERGTETLIITLVIYNYGQETSPAGAVNVDWKGGEKVADIPEIEPGKFFVTTYRLTHNSGSHLAIPCTFNIDVDDDNTSNNSYTITIF